MRAGTREASEPSTSLRFFLTSELRSRLVRPRRDERGRPRDIAVPGNFRLWDREALARHWQLRAGVHDGGSTRHIGRQQKLELARASSAGADGSQAQAPVLAKPGQTSVSRDAALRFSAPGPY